MIIKPYKNKITSINNWKNMLEMSNNIYLIDSFVTGKVKLNMHGTINNNYKFIDKIPSISFYVPVLSHLIFHEKYGYYLIDAGLDKSYYTNGYGRCRGTLVKNYGSYFIQEKNSSTFSFIENLNIELNGIFLTHTHVDHVSGIADLDDNIPIYFSNREKSMDIKPFYYAEYFKNKKDIRILNINNFVEAPILGKCMDIFQDNSLYAIYTPGHTPGHLSYLLNGSQKILFMGDACYTRHGIKYRTASSDYTWNTKMAQSSLERLLRFKDKYNNIKLLPGHSL